MGKDKTKKQPTETPKETSETVLDSNEKEIALATVKPAELVKPLVDVTGIASPAMAELIGTHPHPAFVANYFDRIRKLVKATPEDLLELLAKLPPEMEESVTELIKKMDPNRPGLYMADEGQPQLTELRVYQGTGTDPYRPDSTRPGEYYLTSKVNVGKEFVGAVIALWQGRTMWPEDNDKARRPICNSMDRRVGSKYGDCKTCMHRPWRDAQLQACGDDVVAFMLPKDLSDIVMVRFQRTSAKTGGLLTTFARKDLVPWQRWFKLTTLENTRDTRRWFTLVVNPVEDERVPIELTPFCALLEKMASHDFIMPGIGRIYRSAAEVMEDTPSEKIEGSTDADATKEKGGYDNFNVQDT